MSIINIQNLTRDYGSKKGVFDVSIQVEKGEVFGFLGPNGAGKTTTIRHLMGFINPKIGSCQIDGLDCWKNHDEIQKRLGYIPGEINFFDDLTGKEFLKFVADYRDVGKDNRMQEMIERFELDTRSKIKKMSKGMKQKLGIVAAFMHDPDILILDEPTSGLDPLMQNRFIELIAEEKKRGKTILLSSHMLEEVESTCDRIGIIRNGKIVTVDSVETLKKRHMHTYTVHLNSPELAEAFARDFDGECNGNSVTVTAKQSLDTIFMNYYGGKYND
ncbi:MAG: ABC transporter ATP-binding protein [Coprobacillus sp.]|jgi:ABC-2 type transport system ATP-binding protein|nr:ABC transporter ATP-binding protein [Coprobacillus sp.]